MMARQAKASGIANQKGRAANCFRLFKEASRRDTHAVRTPPAIISRAMVLTLPGSVPRGQR
ncbi:hypothetical protein BBF93_10225 [Hyphomonas sp. CACIAM 19H1]|nr:hypothetical protein BBF93_10225 [Hyphomonas sp. CACIAM 19H1]